MAGEVFTIANSGNLSNSEYFLLVTFEVDGTSALIYSHFLSPSRYLPEGDPIL